MNTARISRWRDYAKQRLAYWTLAAEVAERTGLVADAAYCAVRREGWRELLDCLDEAERIAA